MSPASKILGVVSLILLGSTISAFPHVDSDVSTPAQDTEQVDLHQILNGAAGMAAAAGNIDLKLNPTTLRDESVARAIAEAIVDLQSNITTLDEAAARVVAEAIADLRPDRTSLLDEMAARVIAEVVVDLRPDRTTQFEQADFARLHVAPTEEALIARAAKPEDLQAAKIDTSRYPEQTNVPGTDNPSSGDLSNLPNFVKCSWIGHLCPNFYQPSLIGGLCYCVLEFRPGKND
ncbi:hypothetical protein PV10_06370 [Exophiala mesophila]|uniref:Uncharacterized protein n=1 Tax=Exophiala mesophila TaxID=212818 RepID=A0A0D1ZD65_EXOME|nr:uncharacterized protein PV10_06370 [Exophiala mesophila]KIV91879.1 hypothetical protein PV10_06370 [Exophiala mesophila]